MRWRDAESAAGHVARGARVVLLCSRQRDCRARRHWNSTSYRSAAGNIPIGEKHAAQGAALRRRSGAEGSRTPDLCSAIAALSQLSYSPSYPGVRRPFPSRRTGPVTKQPRWGRGRADIVSYDASGGCQAPPDRARRLSLGGRTRPREVTYEECVRLRAHCIPGPGTYLRALGTNALTTLTQE